MKIYSENFCAACYFRSAADYPQKKCLVQLTERCNLHCKHCFVSSNNQGKDMEFKAFREKIVPNFMENQVKKVTLTGGEPFVYPHLLEVVKILCEKNIKVSICTNAVLVTEEFLMEIRAYGLVHFNISLDGFSSQSHGKFRGNDDPKLFERIIRNIELISKYGMLNGILVTPNEFSTINEYRKICKFAKQSKAKYVLMNPLSQFGRGEDSGNLGFTNEKMDELMRATMEYNTESMEMVYIRFPNKNRKPLNGCIAGDITYIFANGDVAYCPYMVFAAKDKVSMYDYHDFLIGNIFDTDFIWKDKISTYKFPVSINDVCKECSNKECMRGCYAAKISQGKKLDECDVTLCPEIFIRKED